MKKSLPGLFHIVFFLFLCVFRDSFHGKSTLGMNRSGKASWVYKIWALNPHLIKKLNSIPPDQAERHRHRPTRIQYMRVVEDSHPPDSLTCSYTMCIQFTQPTDSNNHQPVISHRRLCIVQQPYGIALWLLVCTRGRGSAWVSDVQNAEMPPLAVLFLRGYYLYFHSAPRVRSFVFFSSILLLCRLVANEPSIKCV